MPSDAEEMRQIADFIRLLKRASQGLSLDEDEFQGLLNINDLRERTNLTRRDVFRHDYMMALATYGGSEWVQMQEWAESEEHLFISVEAVRAMAFIATMTKKTEPVQGPVTQVNVPQALPPVQEEKKKGWFRR